MFPSPSQSKKHRTIRPAGQSPQGVRTNIRYGPMADHYHIPIANQPISHRLATAAHDRHAGHSVAMFRDKFWLSFALTIPVVLLSGDVQHWFGYTVPSFRGSALLVPLLGTIIFFYGGLVFIRGAWNEIADHKPGMMTLISLG